ncbi:unnamed protein product [Rotaria sp. Silwood2]|nr:unnamed protein product [Rotaria sp. Silwood2]CAF3079029.1 unnamed protein product [Rotaria sp. Silwood2]CAF3950510.1 unnamed protein product [Rotaria sp. Silwood2]CAF4356494.1 unnamed protein product [Rotaria sp. Silwood2]
MLNIQSIYPLKKRLNLNVVTLTEILGSIYRSIYSFLERIPDFTAMSVHDQTALIEHNVHNAGSMSGLLILRDGDLYGNYAFRRANLDTYGSTSVDGVTKLINRLDINGTLVKLILIVLTFSTCLDVVRPQIMNNNSSLSETTERHHLSSMHLFSIQNKYTDMMFIYMIYRYGYTESAMRFAGLVYNVLQLCVHTTEAATVQEHDAMLNMVIEDTTRKLTTEDKVVI